MSEDWKMKYEALAAEVRQLPLTVDAPGYGWNGICVDLTKCPETGHYGPSDRQETSFLGHLPAIAEVLPRTREHGLRGKFFSLFDA